MANIAFKDWKVSLFYNEGFRYFLGLSCSE